MSMELFTCIFFISSVSEILGYSDIFFLIMCLQDGGAVFAFHGQWEWRNVSGVKFAGTSGYQTLYASKCDPRCLKTNRQLQTKKMSILSF